MPLILNPAPPYDFTLSTFVFSTGDPKIRKAENGRFWQVIRVGGKLVLAEVTAEGTTGNPALKVRLSPDEPLTPGENEQAGDIISRILNLNDYLTPFYKAVRNDPPMHELTKRLRGLKVPTTPTLFEALVDSVIEQQISLAVARTLEARLTKLFGDPLLVDGQTYYAFPTPERVVSATPEQFRSCGLSAMKGEYIRNIAEKVAFGDLDWEYLRTIRDSEGIITELTKIKGVGRWTAELAILRGMHRLDAFPADDLGLRRAIAQRYHTSEKISGEEARKIAAQWGEWKGLAAYYLLIADQMGI
jgi:DNA-3-methyladenine glycosylase II